jgi:hypothetical protein
MKVTHLMAKITISAGILLILSATGFTQKIRYNFAPGTDFAKYKTYKWVKIEGAQYPNQLIDEQIKRSIDAQLASKGLSKTDSNPDLVVTYQAAVNQERQWNAYSTGDGYWGYGGWRGWGGMGMGGMSTTTATSSTINIGSLDLDMYDVATKKQVWRGEAKKTLGNPKSPEKIQKNIDKAMAKLLKNYPPRPKD